jgi:hypothetical protein
MATARKTARPLKTGTTAKKALRKRPAAPSAAAKPPVPKKAGAKTSAANKPAVTPKAEKPAKAKKPKLVRDSFTIPKAEYALFDELKQRAAKLAHPAKKSELLRAGVKALAAMPDAAFLVALDNVPAIKTGRPALSGR